MNRLDARALFARLASDIPRECLGHLFVTGDLAAAYHYKAVFRGRGIKTQGCRYRRPSRWGCGLMPNRGSDVAGFGVAEAPRLLLPGDPCAAGAASGDPALSSEVERLLRGVSDRPSEPTTQADRLDSRAARRRLVWAAGFRYLGIAALGRQTSDEGLEYADPAMMAAANLLSHPEVGSARIESGDLRGVLRSAKDLGRVIALARLEGRDGTRGMAGTMAGRHQDVFPYRLATTGRGHGIRVTGNARRRQRDGGRSHDHRHWPAQRLGGDDRATAGDRQAIDGRRCAFSADRGNAAVIAGVCSSVEPRHGQRDEVPCPAKTPPRTAPSWMPPAVRRLSHVLPVTGSSAPGAPLSLGRSVGGRSGLPRFGG